MKKNIKQKILLLPSLPEEINVDGMDIIKQFTDVFKKNMNIDVYELNYKYYYLNYGQSATQQKILSLIDKHAIDIVFFLHPYDLDFYIDFWIELEKKVFLVAFNGDDDTQFEGKSRYLMQTCDLVCTNDFYAVSKYEQIGINAVHLPSPYEPKKYKMESTNEKVYEVSFVGDISRLGRKEHIQMLIKNGIKVDVFGSGSKKGFVSLNEMKKIYKQSKIVLNFTGIVSSLGEIDDLLIYKRIKQFKGRVTEAFMCGEGTTLVITENSPSIKHYYKINEEIVVFNNSLELIEKIRVFLNDNEKRLKIAEKGYARAINSYDVNKTANFILKTIENLKKDKSACKTVYIDKIFIKNYTSFRFYYLNKFLKYRKYRLALEELILIFKYRTFHFSSFKNFLGNVFPLLRKLKSFIKSKNA